MSKNRLKSKLPQITNRHEAEFAIGQISLTTLNKIKFTAQMDAEIAAIRTRYEASIGACDTFLKEKTDDLRVWAESNPEEFPKARKSIAFVGGTLGFRTGTPALKPLNRSWTWDKVLVAIKNRAFQFIRTKEEVDKDAILAFHAAGPDHAEIVAKVLTPIGVKIVQEETFYIEPNLTTVETRQTTET